MCARPAAQLGSFMLESLVAMLIVALGVLGIVGLYARSVQNIDDAAYRGEAARLAHSLVGRMWVTANTFAALQANFDSVNPGTGAGYIEFRTLVRQQLPNSVAPEILVTAGPTATSTGVRITIRWVHPGDTRDPLLPKPRRFDLNATIGSNL